VTANIETLLDWMRQRVEHDKGFDTRFTHENLVTLLKHIAKMQKELNERTEAIESLLSLYEDT